MKSIGMIGGLSPESTGIYYRHIIRRHREARGDQFYPRMIIASVSFGDYLNWQHTGRWDLVAAGLEREFKGLAAAGADFGLISSNTPHKALPRINCPIPVLDIRDAVAAGARAAAVKTVGLTGTLFTMADGFYQEGLEQRGLQVILPAGPQQSAIHGLIFNELVQGRVTPEGIALYRAICLDLLARGAQSILLACTELAMLDSAGGLAGTPFLDSARLHAEAAWAMAADEKI